MQVNIRYLINIAANDKLDLNLVDICPGNTLTTSRKSLNTL